MKFWPLTPDRMTPRQQGYQAYDEAVPYERCPYDPIEEPEKYAEWVEGWEAGEADENETIDDR